MFHPRPLFCRISIIAPALCLLAVGAARAQLSNIGAQFWHQSSPGIGMSEQTAYFGYTVASGNFNCDAFDDLAIALPYEDLLGTTNAGLVVVLYGSASGLTTDGIQSASGFLSGTPTDGDLFGWRLAAGDFNHDGCADLVVGSPFADITTGNGVQTDAGAINVIYGGPTGLTTAGNQYWYQELPGIPDSSESHDNFGGALAVGDFDGDGIDDLAVAAPRESFGDTPDAGAVHVFFGSNSGLTQDGSRFLYRTHGLPDLPQTGEHLGFSLAAGRFHTDAVSDELAIGCPYKKLSGLGGVGEVLMVSGLGGAVFNSTVLFQTLVGGSFEANDHFGLTLAAGDFDGDGYDEVVIGVPGQDASSPTRVDAGEVDIITYGDRPDQAWTQDYLAPESAEDGDALGSSLSVGDFNGDGVDDLALGVPSEDLESATDGGLVHVLYGKRGIGLSVDQRQILYELPSLNFDGDRFGFSLAAGHFSGHSGSDLAAGVPFKDLSVDNTGAVNVFYSIALFRDGFESGDTSRWSGSLP